MAGEMRKIAVLAPFAAGIGRRPGRVARVLDSLAPAVAAFGRDCVIEVPRHLAAEGRFSLPLLPDDQPERSLWFPSLPRPEPPPDAPVPSDAGLLERVLAETARQDPAGAASPGQSPQTALQGYLLDHPDVRARSSAWQGLSWLLTLDRGGVEWLLADIDPASCPRELHHLEEWLIAEEPELLIVDLPLGNTVPDQETLALIARIADQLLAPALTWLDTGFFGLADWQGLGRLSSLPSWLGQPQYGKWHALTRKNEARLLCAAVGRFAITKESQTDAPPLWLAPVWALAALIVDGQQASGLPYPLGKAAITLPDGTWLRMETAFSDNRAAQFLDCHLAPLLGDSQGRRLAFPGLPLTAGGSLEIQLQIRSLLNWLLPLQARAPEAEELKAALTARWQAAAIHPPAEVDFSQDKDQLILSLHPRPGMWPGTGTITLALFWHAPPGEQPTGD